MATHDLKNEHEILWFPIIKFVHPPGKHLFHARQLYVKIKTMIQLLDKKSA